MGDGGFLAAAAFGPLVESVTEAGVLADRGEGLVGVVDRCGVVELGERLAERGLLPKHGAAGLAPPLGDFVGAGVVAEGFSGHGPFVGPAHGSNGVGEADSVNGDLQPGDRSVQRSCHARPSHRCVFPRNVVPGGGI